MCSPVYWCCCCAGRYVPSLSVCRAVWRVSLRWLERIVGWVHWSSAHRSISYDVVVLACKMTPNSSLPFFYRMLLIIVWYVPNCHIRVCYWECVMLMLRRGCFSYIMYVHSALFLLISQSGQHTTCYMFCIVIYIFHCSLFCFMVICRIVDWIWRYMFEMLCFGRCVWTAWWVDYDT